VVTINRKYFRSSDSTLARSCDRIIGEDREPKKAAKVEASDRVRLDVKVSGGIEIGSWAGASKFESGSIVDQAHGNFEAGTLGPVLQDIFLNDAAEFQYVGEKQAGSDALLEYRFQVPADASHLFFRADGAWIGNIAYQGSIQIDSETFDLRSLMVRNDNLPPETNLCLATDTASYERTRIGSRDFLMPRESVFRTLQTDSGVTEAVIAYSSCREFQSASTIQFAPAEPARGTADASSRFSLPSGLAFTVALVDPIDTDIAAAGDAIVARIRRPVMNPVSKAVLVPADATVRGRIVRMEHFPGTRFVIAIQLETLDVNGLETPVYARPGEARGSGTQTERSFLSRPGVHIVLPRLGEPGNAASFVFGTLKDRYVVPAGYESNWITIAPLATR
jgi:hypothetical protein